MTGGMGRGAGTTAPVDQSHGDRHGPTNDVQSQASRRHATPDNSTCERTGHTGPSADLTDPYQRTFDPFVARIPAGCWITVDGPTLSQRVCNRTPAGPSGLCERHRDELRGTA